MQHTHVSVPEVDTPNCAHAAVSTDCRCTCKPSEMNEIFTRTPSWGVCTNPVRLRSKCAGKGLCEISIDAMLNFHMVYIRRTFALSVNTTVHKVFDQTHAFYFHNSARLFTAHKPKMHNININASPLWSRGVRSKCACVCVPAGNAQFTLCKCL